MLDWVSQKLFYIELQTNYVIAFSKSKLMIRNRYWNIYISGSPRGQLQAPFVYILSICGITSVTKFRDQYSDDTTLYKQCSVKDFAQSVVDFSTSLSHIGLCRPKSSEN